MTIPTGYEDRIDPVWEAFARRHTGNPFLELDTLYALTEPIIDAIEANVRNFFTAEEEKFERDLARTARFGFFHQRPLGGAASPAPAATDPSSLEERQRRSSEQILALLREEMRRAGATVPEIGEFFMGSAERQKRLETRQDAYVGWLVTNAAFRQEVGRLRQRWEEVVRSIRRFPTLPVWFIADVTAEWNLLAAFRDEFEISCCLWGLETLWTWDWPAPMEPHFVGGLRKGIPHLSEAGLTVLSPGMCCGGERIDLQDVARLSCLGAVPDHLSDWVNKRCLEGSDDWGEVRYQHLLWLYRFHELVLLRRYRGSCQGNVERLDCALAAVLKRDPDSVKKLRLQLRRAVAPPV